MSLSRRRMLHTLSVGGVGVAPARQFPTYAMQTGRTSETPSLVPLNRFPRMVQELWPLSALLAGVLTRFDLPDCYRELKKKNLTLLEPWGANSRD